MSPPLLSCRFYWPALRCPSLNGFGWPLVYKDVEGSDRVHLPGSAGYRPFPFVDPAERVDLDILTGTGKAHGLKVAVLSCTRQDQW